jgi:hypothetical protein
MDFVIMFIPLMFFAASNGPRRSHQPHPRKKFLQEPAVPGLTHDFSTVLKRQQPPAHPDCLVSSSGSLAMFAADEVIE